MNSHSADIEAMSVVRKRWAFHLGALGIVVAAILLLFQYEVVSAVTVWWIYPAYSHGFLIIPISAWLVWEKRRELKNMFPAVAPKALLALVPLLFFWLIGFFATINEARQFALIGFIIVAIFVMLGPKVFRVVAFPSFFLLFLVPFGQYFIPPMQQITTWFTDIGLNLLAVPHYTEGTIIDLPNGRFEIAEACAGLRFLIATLALGALFVHLVYTKWWKVGAFLAACVVIPIIANGFRCIGIMALAYWTNDFTTVAENHITAGHVFNSLILVLMFIAGLKFRDVQAAHEQPVLTGAGTDRRNRIAAVAAATVVLIASGPAFAYWREHEPLDARFAKIAFPAVRAGWNVVRSSELWHPNYPRADQELRASLVRGSDSAPPVDVAIEYYARIRTEASMVSSTNHLWQGAVWHPLNAGVVHANLGSQPVQFAEDVISSVTEKRLVWSAYWMEGRFTTNPVLIKLLELKTAFFGHRRAAVIAFSTPIDGAVEDARARLKTAVAALGELPKRLDPSIPEGPSLSSAE